MVNKIKYYKNFDVQKKHATKYVTGCLNLANKICTEKKMKGFINCPIDKKLIKKIIVFFINTPRN